MRRIQAKLVRYEKALSPLVINHQGQFPAVTITYNLAPDITLERAQGAIRQAIAELYLPDTLLPKVDIASIGACAFFMEAFDSTAIVQVLPQMGRDFSVSPVELSLGLTVYMLTTASMTTTIGWMCDRWGARAVFCVALVLFGAGGAWRHVDARTSPSVSAPDRRLCDSRGARPGNAATPAAGDTRRWDTAGSAAAAARPTADRPSGLAAPLRPVDAGPLD